MVRQKCSGIRRSYLDETAFTALKSAGNNGVIKITSSNTAISKKFSTKGLNEALGDFTWQDCIHH